MDPWLKKHFMSSMAYDQRKIKNMASEIQSNLTNLKGSFQHSSTKGYLTGNMKMIKKTARKGEGRKQSDKSL